MRGNLKNCLAILKQQKTMGAIKEKLDATIFGFVGKKGREPSVINIHPDTWRLLVNEINPVAPFGSIVTTKDKELSYRGIKVFRTYDIAPNDFFIS